MATETVRLELKLRQVLGKKVKQLRRTGTIPVHLYGPGMDSRPLQCEQRDLLLALARAGGNTPIIVTVEGEGDEQLTFAREVQWHPLRGDLLHVDFLAVQATQRVTAQVPITVVGESPGAREAGGTAIQQLRELAVEALPLDLPHEVEVDLAQLTDPNGVIRAGDVALAEGVTMLADPDEVVVRIEVAALLEEPEVAAAEEPAEVPEEGTPE
jgi:large subunit ribosomal protein L25